MSNFFSDTENNIANLIGNFKRSLPSIVNNVSKVALNNYQANQNIANQVSSTIQHPQATMNWVGNQFNKLSNFKIPTQMVPFIGTGLSQMQKTPSLFAAKTPQQFQQANSQTPTFTPKDVFNLAKPVWQLPLSTAAQISMSIPGGALNQPWTKQSLQTEFGKNLSKLAFGDEPLSSFPDKYKSKEGFDLLGYKVHGLPSIPLYGASIVSRLMPMGGLKEDVAKVVLKSRTVEEFANLISKDEGLAKQVTSIIKDTKNPLNSVEDIFNSVKQAANNPVLRKTRPGQFTNVAELDNPLLAGKDWQNGGKIAEPLPWEVGKTTEQLPWESANVQKAVNKEVAQEQVNSGIGAKFNNVFSPIKNLTQDIKTAIISHDSALKVAKVDANQLAITFKSNLKPELEWKLLQYSQKPTVEMARNLGLTSEEINSGKNIIEKSQQFNDAIFKRAQDAGIDLSYLQNHIYQIFKESPQQIDQAFQAKGLSGKPSFANKRTIDNFTQGMDYGLTPKFTTFGQLNAAAESSLQTAIANKQLIDTLKKSGQLLPASEAPGYWQDILAKYFPKDQIKYGDGKIIEQGFKAPKELANFLNNYLGGVQKGTGDAILGATAKFSRGAQDIVLSGGIGPLNFFGLGQIIKEASAGRIVKPLEAFFRAYIPGASRAFEEANYSLIREMASQGIQSRGISNYQKIYKNIVSNKSIAETLGSGWNRFVNEPTFGKLMNQLQISFYKDVKTSLLNKGITEAKAIEQAANSTKKFYGISESLGRAQGVDDLITSVFMAPKYREGLINIYGNIMKGLLPTNWGKAEYAGVQRLATGVAVTYGLYNVAQKNLTGNYLWENPPGKEFELVIPVGDPKDKKYISVPFMPGFTAMPRKFITAILDGLRGDVKGAVGEAGGMLSIPLGKAFELIKGKDYFGNDIIQPAGQRDVNLMGEKYSYQGNTATDLALWGIKAGMPGYGRGAVDILSGQTTPAFGIGEMLEAPIRKGTFPNPYFTAKDKAMENLTQDEKLQAEFMTTADAKGGADSVQEAKMMFENPKLLEVKKMMELAVNPKDPLYSRPDNEIRAFLAYRQIDDSQTATKAKMRVDFPWIPQVQWQLSKQYTDSMNTKNTPTVGFDTNSVQSKLGQLFNPAKPNLPLLTNSQPSPMQLLPKDKVQLASLYTSLPVGSLARKSLLLNNSWLRQFWDDQTAYYQANQIKSGSEGLQEYMTSLGITPESTASSSGGFAYSGNPFKGLKKITVAKPTVKKVAMKAAPKFKKTKVKVAKATKIKVIKPPTFKLNLAGRKGKNIYA